MMKVISILVLVSIVAISTIAYAQDGDQSATHYVINRGIFGIIYKGVVSVLQVGEAILFGRYGIKGLNDYFRADKALYEKTPRY